MKQLQRGDSSRILQKRLQGSDMTIYEVYLEQKSGFRILWTEKNEHVLVWYVAKHKSVSRLIKLIDESNKRSEKKRIYQEVDGLELLNNDAQTQDKNDRKNVILDPLGNVPMKRYLVDSVDEISDEDWTPSMVLTAAERDVVDTKGTTLLLGRSGTGKSHSAGIFPSLSTIIYNHSVYEKVKLSALLIEWKLIVKSIKETIFLSSLLLALHNCVVTLRI